MRNVRMAALVVGTLLALPAIGLATQATTATQKKTASTSSAAPQMHATKGVVKSVDSTKLVITRSPQKGPETTFVLNSSTQQPENVKIGSRVEVRYKTEGKQKVATAITLEQPTNTASAPSSASHQ